MDESRGALPKWRPGLWIQSVSRPSNVVLFGSPSINPIPKTHQTQKGIKLEGPGKVYGLRLCGVGWPRMAQGCAG